MTLPVLLAAQTSDKPPRQAAFGFLLLFIAFACQAMLRTRLRHHETIHDEPVDWRRPPRSYVVLIVISTLSMLAGGILLILGFTSNGP